MFDIGFTEILLIGIVALIVVGPEKLPSMVRTVLGYVRQIKSSFSSIREEVERELDLNEMKKDFHDSKASVTQAVGYDDLRDSLGELKKETADLRNFDKFDKDEVSDEDIEADLQALTDEMGPNLPTGDAESETGLEPIPEAKTDLMETKDNEKTVPKKAKKKIKKNSQKETKKEVPKASTYTEKKVNKRKKSEKESLLDDSETPVQNELF